MFRIICFLLLTVLTLPSLTFAQRNEIGVRLNGFGGQPDLSEIKGLKGIRTSDFIPSDKMGLDLTYSRYFLKNTFVRGWGEVPLGQLTGGRLLAAATDGAEILVNSKGVYRIGVGIGQRIKILSFDLKVGAEVTGWTGKSVLTAGDGTEASGTLIQNLRKSGVGAQAFAGISKKLWGGLAADLEFSYGVTYDVAADEVNLEELIAATGSTSASTLLNSSSQLFELPKFPGLSLGLSYRF